MGQGTPKLSETVPSRMKRTQEEIEAAFVAALADGVPPDDERAIAIAEEAREHIEANFFPCSRSMHVKLAEMYEADPRFRHRYEDQTRGLARYVACAIRANADRQGKRDGKPRGSAKGGGGNGNKTGLPRGDSPPISG